MAAETPSDSEPELTGAAAETTEPAEHLEEFPEFEELTPELMEDECLRGDTMLRWALILLAMLLGWTTLTESGLLVQIKTGEYLLSHGILPPREDVFSGSAAGRAWVNSSWMSDLVLGAIHHTVGAGGLTVLCAVTVAAAFFFLSRIQVPGVSTWWGSFCSFIALVALFPTFQPGASAFTILALAILLWALSSESFLPPNAENLNPIHRFSWNLPYLPVLFFFWVNMDSRAWVGLFLLLMFMLEDSLSRFLHKRPQSRRDWGIVLVTFLVAMLLSPWPFQQLLNVISWYKERHALQVFSGGSEFFPRLVFGLKDPELWKFRDMFLIASLVMLAISFVTILLNFKKLKLGWLGVWLAVNAVSFVDGDYVCYAALVNAVVATLNGQFWYRENFSMAYSIDTLSVLWGRAGRAAMVFSFFVVAYLALNGAFMGSQGRRLGLGLDPRWSARIASMRDEVVAHSYSDRIFPTIPAQGDVLAWIDKKPFIDSRFSLYLSGNKNLLEVHQQTRKALFSTGTREQPVDSADWKKTLHEFKFYDVVTRLWGSVPPYEPVVRLLASPTWVLTGLGAAGANFTRIDQPDEPLLKHVQEYSATQFAQQAFRPRVNVPDPELQGVWPIPVSRYDQWLIQKLATNPSAAELAGHYDQLLSILDQGMPIEQVSGMTFLAIRHARQALAEDPNSALAYRVLAHASRVLQEIEAQIVSSVGMNASPAGEFSVQILAAANAAVIAGDDNAIDLQRLLEVTLQQQMLDVSLQILIRFENALQQIPGSLISEERRKEFADLHTQLQMSVDEVKKQVNELRTSGAAKSQLVGAAMQGRCPELALSLLEEDLTEIERSPELKLLYGSLQMQAGRFDSALQTLEQMETMWNVPNPPPQMQPIIAQWQNQAANANLATQDYNRALELWQKEDLSFVKSALRALLQVPFGAMSLPVQYELWPAYNARMAAGAAIEVPERLGQLQLRCARIELLDGKLEAATNRLRLLLKHYPQCSQRFIAGFYLGLLTGEKVEVAPLPAAPAVTPQTEATPPSAATPAEKPAADKPVGEPPAPDKPSAEKPVEEKKTEEKPAEPAAPPSDASTDTAADSGTVPAASE